MLETLNETLKWVLKKKSDKTKVIGWVFFCSTLIHLP